MKIKFIKPWRLHSAGDIVDAPSGVAAGLIQQGRAVEVKEEKKVVKKQAWVK